MTHLHVDLFLVYFLVVTFIPDILYKEIFMFKKSTCIFTKQLHIFFRGHILLGFHITLFRIVNFETAKLGIGVFFLCTQACGD